MSGGESCKCPERDEPFRVAPGSNRAARLWRVIQRYCNHSAFNGYHHTPSRWSSLCCLRCGACWRTTAAYVDEATDYDREREQNIRPGCESYEKAMLAYGRDAEAPT